MATELTIQSVAPSGEKFVLEYDDGVIVGVSESALTMAEAREVYVHCIQPARLGIDTGMLDLRHDEEAVAWARAQSWGYPKTAEQLGIFEDAE